MVLFIKEKRINVSKRFDIKLFHAKYQDHCKITFYEESSHDDN